MQIVTVSTANAFSGIKKSRVGMVVSAGARFEIESNQAGQSFIQSWALGARTIGISNTLLVSTDITVTNEAQGTSGATDNQTYMYLLRVSIEVHGDFYNLVPEVWNPDPSTVLVWIPGDQLKIKIPEIHEDASARLSAVELMPGLVIMYSGSSIAVEYTLEEPMFGKRPVVPPDTILNQNGEIWVNGSRPGSHLRWK